MTLGDNSMIYGLDTHTLDTTSLEPVISPVSCFDLMSYCRLGIPEDRWPSSVTYSNLLNSVNSQFDRPAILHPLAACRNEI